MFTITWRVVKRTQCCTTIRMTRAMVTLASYASKSGDGSSGFNYHTGVWHCGCHGGSEYPDRAKETLGYAAPVTHPRYGHDYCRQPAANEQRKTFNTETKQQQQQKANGDKKWEKQLKSEQNFFYQYSYKITVHARTQAHTHVRTYTYSHVHARTYARTHTHTQHTHTYTHTHMRARALAHLTLFLCHLLYMFSCIWVAS